MAGRIHIEDDWYLIPDERSWNIARMIKRKDGSYGFTDITYHSTVERALEFYLQNRRSDECKRSSDGKIEEALRRLQESNKEALNAICKLFNEALEACGGDFDKLCELADEVRKESNADR